MSNITIHVAAVRDALWMHMDASQFERTRRDLTPCTYKAMGACKIESMYFWEYYLYYSKNTIGISWMSLC